MALSTTVFNALIKTHHITSRKKVSHLKKHAHKHVSYVLLRSGGAPGLMYVEGSEDGVREWVAAVQGLRYKDYHLLRKPAPLEESHDHGAAAGQNLEMASDEEFEEAESVARFATRIEKRGVLQWWRSAMGYRHGD
ncbi:hypothetical protein FIBSPDRAFT_855249 [Athelia psychrophila]|uniref:Uncharacterized protein n=1 Tax=Athelia psychrophila TaxID=1759441 RepID=A0A166PCS6_9AGAM|nr:hypothetical protein FIBSPDRAFT_855249 [Fibularhizoctonia sp. CBS 109695]